MASDIGNAYVNIIPKAPNISSNIENILDPAAESSGKSAGNKIGSGMMSTLGKVVSVAAVTKLVKDAFSAGGELQQSFGGLETIYGDAAEQAKKFAMEAATAGISANDYAEQAVSFGAALKQAYGGDTEAAMQAANTAIMDMADNSAKMGTDIGSIQAAYQGFAKQNYTMLDNLKLGYGGTKSEMERLLADAQELSGVEYNIDNLGDVYDAIHVIQENLGLTGVAATEAQTTLTGSFGALKASWTNLMAALTTGEGMDAAIANFTAAFSNFGTNVIGMLQNLAPQLPAMIMGLADAIIASAPEFIASGIELIIQLAAGLLAGIPDLIAKVPEIFARTKEAFAGVDWAGLGKDIITGIVSGLWNSATNLYNSVKNIIRNALNRGKEEAEVGSPSRLFADEIGKWIPAGVAVGIEENMMPVNRAMSDLLNMASSDMTRVNQPSLINPYQVDTSIDYDQLAEAISRRPIVIQADTGRIFKIVNQTNQIRTRATGYNALGAVT